MLRAARPSASVRSLAKKFAAVLPDASICFAARLACWSVIASSRRAAHPTHD
jgi:hypothetical protein